MKKDTKGLFLRVLLNRSHGSITDSLLNILPIETAEEVKQHQISAIDPLPIIHQPLSTLNSIHYSWIHSYLKSMSPSKSIALIACLGPNQRIRISQLKKIPPPKPISSSLLKQFYLRNLYPLLKIEAHFPMEYLLESPFSYLLKLKKQQLIQLIDLLSMYDLAHEIRQIVATKNLRNLYACLTPVQQQFLRTCLHQNDKIKTPSLHLDRWDGNSESLSSLLHRRGLIRFSMALSGQEVDFIWHLTHILDIGRGTFVQKQVRPKEVPYLTSAFALQVHSAKNLLT